ncbi:LacI family DNA-binding transcriptional regulator [Bifidobacterium sp. SMB2]|uniref:LacI family DNA-binding transcriptional regulator n=1 Tax=Bifidobacterium saimiriisciurei TaxID=2661627 RepID=A0ABX0CHM1_9BIFI|nr:MULTISPECIES: LacI family DNA-binding transcriptional regulator [Bifidobacterium]NEG95460.1 LacI family DNA-binding transcriptional regulator [Bifidobacterium sp. SMB2]NEH12183.1 LacI family DNA-binding transcriptional regulator [Bifidobacterium saimiriisciurei]
MVGMRDVARRAGVSLSTVSLAVNGTGYVADETRERIEAAMAELDYVPNDLARSLSQGRTNLVGVTIPTIAHPFFAQLTAAIQGRLHKAGLRVMLCSTADQDRGEAEYIDMLRRHTMDGIIIGSHTSRPPAYWQSIGRPIVAFDRYLGDGIPSVCSDHEAGGHLAARRFIDTGVRHVVEIGGPRSQFHDLAGADGAAPAAGGASAGSDLAGRASASAASSPADTTFPTVRYHRTFERDLAEAGVRCDYITIEHVSDLDLFEQAAEEAFRRFPDADAIIAPDLAAAHCVRLAIARGRRIPDDLQIIAYDGTPVTALAGRRITTVRQDIDAIADRLAVAMMAAMGEGHAGPDAAGDADSASAAAVASDAAGLVPVALVDGETTR